MATINSVPKSIHLPLTTSLSSAPRVLMCSASVGTEASVTLQLRDVNSNDSIQSNQSSSEAAAAAATIITSTSTNNHHTGGTGTTATSATTTTTTLDNALTIGYPDPEMLADVLGTLQTASLKNTNNPSGESTKQNSSKLTNTSDITNNNLNGTIKNRITISKRSTNIINNSQNTSSNNNSNIINNNNNNSNYLRDISKTTTTSAVQTVTTSTNTTTAVNKTNSYIKNCLIRSSSCSNTTNITSLAQIMSNSSNSSNSNTNNNNNGHSNSNSNSNQINNNSTTISCNGISNNNNNSNNNLSQLNNNNSNTTNSSNNSCNSNFSSSSNDSCFSYSSNSSSGNSVARSITSLSHGSRKVPGPLTTNPPKILKKSRSKISSPSRHGPQQCQICNKIFGNASALAKHKLTHSDERKYVCVMCSKAFKRQDHLNGHMMTHRNKKPYECKAEGCGKSYCDARSLRRHTENHHAGVIAPHNHQLLISNNNSNSNLSLSPATANGDASSPDGATCLGTYLSNGGTVVDAATGLALTEEELKALNVPLKTGVTLLSPTSTTSSMSSSSSMSNGPGATITLTDNSGNLDGEGLTREQLDLISKIMRQTKQTTAQVTVSSPTSSQSYKIDTNPPATAQTQTQNARPRTWNMQLLNSSQNVAITVDEINADNVNDSSANAQSKIKEDEIEIDLSNTINSNLFNLVKIDQKPVECNLCHRKFKNVPALNGHMRLHGGYFKKDPETKKSEKKENSGPPLQTASIGVRALIEEKIISKRSKDLNKGAFVVPAPPTSSTPNNTTTIRRSISDLDSFLNPKTQPSSTTTTNQQQNSTQQQQPQQQLPAVTTIKNNPKSNINVQDINLPQSIEIYSTKQQQQQQPQQQQQQQHHQQQKTMNNIGVGTTTTTILNAERSATKTTTTTAATINTTTTRSTSTDPKDSTLIELLKRGTRIAVTQKQPNNNNTPLGGVTRQIITNKNNCSVIIPSEVQVVSTKGKLKKDDHMQMTNATNVTLPDGTPLSLTIAQGADSNSEVYTVTYTSDGSALFGENEVYNVSEAEMLLQTVDTMQLLSDAGDNLKPEHSEQFEVLDNKIEQQNCVDQQQQLHQQQQQLQQNSNQCQTTQTLPNFQHFHSKELIIQNPTLINHQQIRTNTLSLPQDMKNQFASSLNSPIHSPLAYPTPPSSHENVTQTSPYIEDNHHFSDAPNIFFSESLISSNNAGESENDKIMKLKSVLEDNSFDSNIKVEDLLNGTDPDTECDLREFAEANLSFLDEDQEFLNDSRNATSPLSESFFTSGIGTAEEVKEVLREVLTEDQLNLNCENQGENIIDLYYLPGLSLQSQMMPNSEDPLLSSSPRDFGQQQKLQNPMPQQQQQTQPQAQQQSQIQHIPHQQPQQQIIQYNNQQQLTHPVKISLDTNTQISTGSTNSSSEINQLILNIPSNVIQNSCNPNSTNSSSAASSTTTTIHYNVQNLPQVQNQSNIQQQPQLMMQQQQQQHQTQFLTSTTINSLNEALMQPIIYTSGTTDKMELKLDNNPNSTNPQLQNIISLNKPLEIVKNTASSSHIIFPQQNHSSNSIASTSTVSTSLQPLSNQTNSILKRRLKGHSSLDSTSSHPSYSKYQALSPYKSKLRKPSRTHYTPAPILNPERKGHGLYCNVLKQLGCSLLSFDNFDDDFDDPVGLVDFSDESKVNLGSAYQASIPAFNENFCSTSAIEETVGCDLMWNPEVQKDDKILMRFIDLSKSSAVPLGSHSEEVALEALLKAQGNTATAVLSLLQTQSNSFQIKWSSQELEIFLKGLEKHGKEFSKISKELGSKTTGECVQMYYFWKKLCVDYKVTHLKTETPPQNHANDPKPYVCEIPDCSARRFTTHRSF